MTLCYRRSVNKRAGRLKVNTDQRVKSCNPAEGKQRDPPPVPLSHSLYRYQTIIGLYQSEVQDIQIECGCLGISQSCMREVIIMPNIGVGGLGNAFWSFSCLGLGCWVRFVVKKKSDISLSVFFEQLFDIGFALIKFLSLKTTGMD
ncbi:hypothetical protein CEXT_722221 [Caerostris extrusa]|uniref:Uncharacterized protein n=1 Tax=Caerostris extrusa TaxID=172846 RepID=A0AAV4Y3L6_CAEEX|nr:hypothetical protein CEXT_722221 [Caerostris extrusa]